MQDNGFENHARKETASRRETLIIFILCVVASFFIWLYVMSVDSPTATETYTAVPVTIIGTDGTNLSAISGTDQVIEVKLKGRKTILNSLKAEDIEATVDVSSVTTAGKGRFPVVVEAPSGTIVDDFYPAEVSVYMDEKTIVSVPVRGRLTDYTVNNNYTLDLVNYTRSIDNVQVSGPVTELEKIDYARVTLHPGTNITQSFSGTGPLELVDVNGNIVNSKYVTLLTPEATVSYSVYTTKYINLNVAYKYGYFEDGMATVTVSPNRIRVRGLAETVSQMTSLTVATIDETKIAEDGTSSYGFALPDGVEFPEETQNVDTVSVTVKFHQTTLNTVTFPTSDILVTNIPAGTHVTMVDKSIGIRVRGTPYSYPSNKSAFTVTLDMSAAGTNTGTQYVPVTVVLRDGSDATHYVVGDYSVQVNIDAEGGES